MNEPAGSAGLRLVTRAVLDPARAMAGGVLDHLGAVARAPEYRRLRQMLLLSALVQFILAPLTSWSIDTNTFVQSGVITLYTGNPYAGGSWYNAPLGPFATVPTLGILTELVGPGGIFQAVPGLAAIAARADYPTLLPTPAALLAWKLPFIVAGLGMGIAIDWALRTRSQGLPPNLGAALWLLNPLVLWAIAVHGEVDGLAALWIMLALLGLASRHWFLGGIGVALAFVTKGYPIVLLPIVLLWVVLTRADGVSTVRRVASRIGQTLAGFAVGLLPFAGYLLITVDQLTARSVIGIYGALSVTVIFNPAVPKGYGPYFAFTSHTSNAAAVLFGLTALGALGVLAGLVLFAQTLRRPGEAKPPELPAAALLGVVAVSAVLLADPIPNAENLLGLLPLAILAVPRLPKELALRLITGISCAGLLQYFSILTPLAFFYPLAAQFGSSGVAVVNAAVLAYLNVPGLRGLIWLMVGVIGGLFTLAFFGAAVWHLVPEAVRARVPWRRFGRRADEASG